MEQTNNYIRLAADPQIDSIVDGPGLRTVIWTQGCPHHCKGCQNPQTWNVDGGGLVPISEVKKFIDEIDDQDGITFSGGDPMYQPEACFELAKYAKNKGFNIWVYTGYTYEEIIKLSKSKPVYLDFLKIIDVLVDGKFILEERDLSLLFRGSRNQRLIDVSKTLRSGKIVLFDEDEYSINTTFERSKTFV